ncbi:MAG: molybdopterin molybdotransferase MoeA [Candidatus Lokiarchaeota archaeon]|nr:molybdopterin molybdotransferase MoeA [Candidatus Lokiarchaeota archaeon]
MERLRKIGFSKLTPLEEASDLLLSNISLTTVEVVETSSSLGRFLAESIKSGLNIPPFDRSAMDGYAVKAEDTFGSSPQNPRNLKLVGKIEIGEKSEGIQMKSGEAIRISTGAAIPLGADAVVKIEDTKIEEANISIYLPIVPGKNVSRKGEDIPQDSIVLNSGTEIFSSHIALLSSLGIETVKVHSRPKVSVFATGDELVEVGQMLGENQIYNSNSPMISNLTQQYGGTVIREETLKDDKILLKKKLYESVEDSDLVIFTGGTSVGTQDFLPETIQENGTILVHGIAIKPGSPVLIGVVEDKIVFCLPGTPVAAYLCFVELVGMALRKMMGASEIDPRTETVAKMSRDVPVSGMGYIHFLRVKIEKLGNEIIAHPVKLKGSGIISSLVQSDGIVKIHPYQEGLKKDDKVFVIRLK